MVSSSGWPPDSRVATVRSSSARAASNVSPSSSPDALAAVRGSAGVVILAFLPLRDAPDPGRDQHTYTDADDRRDGSDEEERGHLEDHRPGTDGGGPGTTSAATSPWATRMARVVPGGASAGSRTMRPSEPRRT